MNINEMIDAEMANLKSQMTRNEWFALEPVIRESLTRLAMAVNSRSVQ